VAEFRRGDLRYFGLVRDTWSAQYFAKDAAEVQIRFPVKGYVRERLAGRDCGKTDRVTAMLTPSTVLLYSVLPYSVKSVAVSVAATEVARGDAVRYAVAVKAKGRADDHVLRLDVRDPDGKESKAYSRNLTALGGRAAGTIPLALNDKPGEWTLAVKDMASGREQFTTFTVR
jgi:hypothetical protein